MAVRPAQLTVLVARPVPLVLPQLLQVFFGMTVARRLCRACSARGGVPVAGEAGAELYRCAAAQCPASAALGGCFTEQTRESVKPGGDAILGTDGRLFLLRAA